MELLQGRTVGAGCDSGEALEQAAHNYLLRSGALAAKVSALHTVPSARGLAVHAAAEGYSLVRDAAGRALAGAPPQQQQQQQQRSDPPALVHGYSRHAPLLAQLQAAHIWVPDGSGRVEHY